MARSLYISCNMASVATSSATVGKYLCGHCNQKISKTLYYQHKKLFYSASTKSWKKEIKGITQRKEVNSPEPQDFRFSDDEEEHKGDQNSIG